MGLYNGVNTSVEAILTTLGRKYLSTDGTVNITKYALSDEEIDYTLYDTTHPNGTDAYGTVIENMNVLEAFPNRDSFQSHLTDAKTSGAKIQLSPLNYTGVEAGDELSINPNTVGGPGGAENYSFTVANANILKLVLPSGGVGKTVGNASSIVAIAQEFVAPQPDGTTNITVTGLESGLVAVVSVTVKYTPTSGKDGLGPEDPNGDPDTTKNGKTNGSQQNGGIPPGIKQLKTGE